MLCLLREHSEERLPLSVGEGQMTGLAVLRVPLDPDTEGYTESPEWGFTREEQAIPALFLASTWTWPTDRRLGWILARWALDHAARGGFRVVRRGTFAPALVRYYQDVQGWSVVREVERRPGKVCTFLSRAAELRTDVHS